MVCFPLFRLRRSGLLLLLWLAFFGTYFWFLTSEEISSSNQKFFRFFRCCSGFEHHWQHTILGIYKEA